MDEKTIIKALLNTDLEILGHSLEWTVEKLLKANFKLKLKNRSSPRYLNRPKLCGQHKKRDKGDSPKRLSQKLLIKLRARPLALEIKK